MRRRAERIAANILNPPAGTGSRAVHYARLNQRVVHFPRPDLPFGRTKPKAVKGEKLADTHGETAVTAVATRFLLETTGNTYAGNWGTAGLASVSVAAPDGSNLASGTGYPGRGQASESAVSSKTSSATW